MCELFMAEYTFHVLINAFVVHRGFKKQDDCYEIKMKENQINWQIFSRVSTDID